MKLSSNPFYPIPQNDNAAADAVNSTTQAKDVSAVDTEKELLFDYCRVRIYDLDKEITVNRGSDGKLYFHEYIGGMANGIGKDTHNVFFASEEALDELLTVAKGYADTLWREESFNALSGGRTIVKYLNEDGTMSAFNTEFMPYEGCGAVYKIYIILEKYLRKAEPVKS